MPDFLKIESETGHLFIGKCYDSKEKAIESLKNNSGFRVLFITGLENVYGARVFLTARELKRVSSFINADVAKIVTLAMEELTAEQVISNIHLKLTSGKIVIGNMDEKVSIIMIP